MMNQNMNHHHSYNVTGHNVTGHLILCHECANPRNYIIGGYRHGEITWRQCCCSILTYHNETCNIWTHLVPGLFAVYLLFKEASAGNTVIALYCLCMTAMFATSTLYHTFSCMDRKTTKLFLKMDLTGILILMWGSNLPIVTYGFNCESTIRTVYFGTGTIVVFIAWSALMRNPYSAHSAILLLFVVAFSAVEVIHENIMFSSPQLTMPIWFRVFGTYLVGAGFYVSRVPERWAPGRFDYIGNSHQIWHLAVTLGAFLQYYNAHHYLEHFLESCLASREAIL